MKTTVTAIKRRIRLYAGILLAGVGLFAGLPSPSQAATGAFTFSAAGYAVSEGAGSVAVTIKRVDGSSGAATVAWRTNSQTATYNADYTSFSWTTLSFAAGETQKVQSIKIVNDTVVEPDETFTITLANPSVGTSLGTIPVATVTIKANDDTIAPTVAIGSPVSGTVIASPQTLSVTASAADNVGVSRVEFYDGTVLKSTVTVPPYSFAYPLSNGNNGSHMLTAKAFDIQGLSKVSTAVTVTVSIDTTAPSVTLSSPANGASYVSAQAVSLAATASDNVGVTRVEFYDGSILLGSDSSAPYSCSWVIDSADNGSHSLKARAYDAAGNSNLSALASVTVAVPVPDTTAPSVSLSSPANGVSFSSAQTVTIAATASDNVGVTKVEFSDGSILLGSDSSSPYSFSWSLDSSKNGSHTLSARAYDAAGNSKQSTAVSVTVNIPVPVVNAGPLRVFPGAEGFGTDSVAGRGGQIIKVTNLNDSGPGSLRDAVQASGARIVVFEVSGYIDLKSQIRINNPYLTVAGQTAPSPGICVRNWGVTISSHDILIQHLAIRPGNPTNVTDGLEILGPSSKIVIDHCSITWGTDENASTWYDNVNDITFSNNLIAEGLMSHSMGLLLGAGFDRASLVRNVLAHNNGRNPRVQTGRTHDAYMVMVNNLIYNHYWDCASISMAYENNAPVHVSSLNNLALDGPQTKVGEAMYGFDANPGYTLYYSGDAHYPFLAASPTGLIYTGSGVSNVKAPTSDLSGYSVLQTSAVEGALVANSGARPADRDPNDQRILNSIVDMNGGWITTPAEVGGYSVLSQSYRTLSLPANPGGDDDGDGYTNIEELLYQLALQVEGR